MKRAFCNEIVQAPGSNRRWIEGLEFLRSLGFEGVEIAPFTLGEDPAKVGSEDLRSIRLVLEQAGLRCIGFHWLWSAPPGLKALHPDPSMRRKAWDTLRVLARECAELGGEFLVLGSGKQRSFEGMSSLEARRLFLEELAGILPVLEETGVALLLEPLPRSSTNFLNTLEEVVSLLKEIDSPFLRTIFDFHNTTEETLPWERLVEKFGPWIRHVHFNGVNGNLPSPEDLSFTSLFRALRRMGYTGWVSVELFGEFSDPEALLKRAWNLLSAYEEASSYEDTHSNENTPS